jgi:hypothetical protein
VTPPLSRPLGAFVFALALAGCSTAPLQVGNVQIGRSLSSDRSVGSPTTVFKPDDTVYVSIQTTDTGSGTVGAKWMFGERVISEPTQKVSYKGPAYSEFHIQNSGGLPVGSYSVEAFVDGRSVGKRTFTVKR